MSSLTLDALTESKALMGQSQKTAYTVYSGITGTDTVAESVTERFLTERKQKFSVYLQGLQRSLAQHHCRQVHTMELRCSRQSQRPSRAHKPPRTEARTPFHKSDLEFLTSENSMTS